MATGLAESTKGSLDLFGNFILTSCASWFNKDVRHPLVKGGFFRP